MGRLRSRVRREPRSRLFGTHRRPIERLRRALPLSHAATVRLIDRLRAEDLVVRRPSPVDGRAVALYLTEAGERRCDAILAVRQKRIAYALGALDESERETLGSLVSKLLTNLVHTEDDGFRMSALQCRGMR